MSQNKGKVKKVHPACREKLIKLMDNNSTFLMKSTKSEKLKRQFYLKATTFIKHKIHNFDCQYFYEKTLPYKEFLKLATLSKKQWQTVEPQ